MVKDLKPSVEVVEDLQVAYDFFNERLFASELSPCVITFSRKRGAYGYFFARRWGGVDAQVIVHEIGLNPAHMERGDRDVLGTLVHEMVHLWQEEHGNPPKNVYHNAEWADKMEEVGLMPSTTGAEGGKRTGVKCSHYILDGGPFAQMYDQLTAGGEFKLRWTGVGDAEAAKRAKRVKDKLKYTCGCDHNVWGKAGLSLRCDDCGELLEQEKVD